MRAVPLIPGESPEAYREKLETVMREADDGSGSGTIVLSDIAGGTPSRVPHIFQRISNSGLFPV